MIHLMTALLESFSFQFSRSGGSGTRSAGAPVLRLRPAERVIDCSALSLKYTGERERALRGKDGKDGKDES